jgi:hypothetical protein
MANFCRAKRQEGIANLGFIETFMGVGSRFDVKPDHLSKFIEKQVEENLNLDYQEIPADKKVNFGVLSEDVSSFANSAGGLLALGLSEKRVEGGNKPGLPGEITWTSTLTKEALEGALLARIHPWIDSLIIHPVRDSEGKSIFLLDIPQSMKAPHQAGDGAYYLRHNFQKLRMEHYQIVDMMNRRVLPILRPVVEVLEVAKDGREVVLQFGLENEGNLIAKHPLLFIACHDCEATVTDSPLFGLHSQGEQTDAAGEKVVILAMSTAPWAVIHPQMRNYFGTCKVSLTNTACYFRISVGAELAPTHHFLVSLGEKFARKLSVQPNQPEELGSWREDQLTSETIFPYMRQAGMGEEETKAFANLLVETIKKRMITLQSQDS